MILGINILIALISILLLLYLAEKDLGLFIISFMILVQYVWMFLSLIEIESGIYINEQGRTGYFVFSSVVLLLFYITTLISLVFFKKLFNKVFKNLKATRFKFLKLKEEKVAIMLLATVIATAFINLLLSPMPFFSDTVNKFNFWDYARFPFLKSIVGNVMVFVIFGATLLLRFNKKVSLLLITLYILYLILIGQKFTGFFIALYGIAIALYYSSRKSVYFKLKWIFNKYSLGILASLFLLVWYRYTIKNPFEYIGLTPLESVFYRTFGLQAHLFWGVTEQYIFLDKPHSWNITELWEGMRVLMLEFWPSSYKDYISVTTRGVSWTNAYPSILIRIFPLGIALIVNFLLISIVSLFQILLVKFIRGNSILLSIVFFQLLVWVNYSYTMAYFNKLKIPFVLLLLFLIYKYLIYMSNATKVVDK